MKEINRIVDIDVNKFFGINNICRIYAIIFKFKQKQKQIVDFYILVQIFSKL